MSPRLASRMVTKPSSRASLEHGLQRAHPVRARQLEERRLRLDHRGEVAGEVEDRARRKPRTPWRLRPDRDRRRSSRMDLGSDSQRGSRPTHSGPLRRTASARRSEKEDMEVTTETREHRESNRRQIDLFYLLSVFSSSVLSVSLWLVLLHRHPDHLARVADLHHEVDRHVALHADRHVGALRGVRRRPSARCARCCRCPAASCSCRPPSSRPAAAGCRNAAQVPQQHVERHPLVVVRPADHLDVDLHLLARLQRDPVRASPSPAGCPTAS